MSVTNDEPLRVLRFWRDLEIFNIPTAPSYKDATEKTQVKTLRRQSRDNVLPWRHKDFAPTKTVGHVHVVYVGVADTEDLSRLLLQGLFPSSDQSERERERVTGSGWLAAFVVDELGRPKPYSYLPASFAQGVAALRETQALDNINARLARAKEEFAQRRTPLAETQEQSSDTADAEHSIPAAAVLDWKDLDEELEVVRDLLGEAANDPALDWRVVVRSIRVKRRYLDEDAEAATDFLNSFFLEDLDRLIAQAERKQPFGKALSTYLGSPLPESRRVDILIDPTAMSALVGAKHLPAARWPASPKHPLVIAQQAAVSHVTRLFGRTAEGLAGVNGPPGTGKTTLLCDVIAEIVTERARRIAALDRPVALFEDRVVVAGQGFFPLKAEVVAGTSIVVTSTNNNAVKNITLELPARKKIADEFRTADYFAEVMREVFRAQKVEGDDKQPVETWGLVAAALGNAGNRNSFARGFFRDEAAPKRQTAEASEGDAPLVAAATGGEADEHSAKDGEAPSMKQLLETAHDMYQQYQAEWKQAKQVFLTLQLEFEQCRKVLERAEKAAKQIDDEEGAFNRLVGEERELDRDIKARGEFVAHYREAVSAQRAVVDGSRAVLEQLRANRQPNLWDRFWRLFGRETRRMIAIRQTLEAPTQALSHATASLAETAKAGAIAEAQLKQQQERQKTVAANRIALGKALDGHRLALEAGYATGAKHFTNAKFWALPADVRHRASIGVSPKLDELRAKLFLQAIELHRLTVLTNAGKFIANLRAVSGMLTGRSRDKLALEHRPLLWDALFFVVPVVSSTLASFDRLFVGMPQNSLGWLLIDEAGQATPQSAAGALWRSQRAVIVGDPLQIEPVFTVPRDLVENLRRRHNVTPHWSPIDESVQTLADRITPFGSWVQKRGNAVPSDTPERLWTGMPLRTHRRCDDPMFTVANQIAYAGQMVQGRVDKTGRPVPWDFACSLGASTWFDVRSSHVNHPVSEDEIAVLLDCLTQLRHEMDGKAKIYVISPFRKIAHACRRRVEDAKLGGVECGTVHTFQGKEAEVVFLVLGTAPGQAGLRARGWAASQPNLLNVAVTRAQCRLYVIGDVSQWGGLEYFQDLRSALPIKRSVSAGEG